MAKRIKSGDLSQAMADILNQYTGQVTEVVKASARTAGNYARDQLRETSPKDTGGYAEGWRSKTLYETSSGMDVIIHNAKKPGLAHLLENGHAKRGGGRAPAVVHIRPVEETVTEELEANIRRSIAQMG